MELKGYPIHLISLNNQTIFSIRPPPRLLDQLREKLRYKHYSVSTEKLYLYWVRFFIRWSGLRHPLEMGAVEVEAFLTMLATERQVSPSTHKQALSALLFLFRDVLNQNLPWLDEVITAKPSKRLPVVLTTRETTALQAELNGTMWLIASLLYGTGMRLFGGFALISLSGELRLATLARSFNRKGKKVSESQTQRRPQICI